MIVDHVVFVVVVLVVVLAFAVDAAAAELDVVISADVAVIVFHLLVVHFLFVVAAGASGFENGDGDFAVSCYFSEIFAVILVTLMMLLSLLIVGYI